MTHVKCLAKHLAQEARGVQMLQASGEQWRIQYLSPTSITLLVGLCHVPVPVPGALRVLSLMLLTTLHGR